MSTNAPYKMHTDFCPLAVSLPPSQLQCHSCIGMQTINAILKCPPNVAPEVKISSCIYPEQLLMTLCFVLTSTSYLIVGDRKQRLRLEGTLVFVLDVKIGHAANCW